MQDVLDEFDDRRKRLARKLHATAAQHLAALQLNLSLAERAALPERAAKALSDASELAQLCAREIRDVCNQLHPPLLDEIGLAAAVRAFAGEQGCRVAGDFPEDGNPIPHKIALGAFRIVEQLILDSRSKASATIGVKFHAQKLVLAVSCSAPIRDSVRLRVDTLGGELWASENDSFRTVIVSLPLTSEEF